MKTLIRLLCLPLLSVAILSCGESHFLKEKSYRDQVTKDFEQKQQALSDGDLFAVFSKEDMTLSEREALMFLYAYMPIGDITDYSGEYYLENVRQSEQTRREMAWGKTVPDELYRHFVLPLRVNNENLDDSRKVFYEELKERVSGLSMEEAILEVNHWCHEKVVYRPSDSRTSSALATVRTAFGRCGEESTFAVAALRAVGIPARQVYTPRWAHTDDNHAWVEAWADGQWHFLGACEPEPVLDLGWFNAPASRGMLMHTKVFGRYDGEEETMLETSNYTEINVTGNYAPTATATVTVTDEGGQPVPRAKVEFKVYNYAEFYTVATKYADADGRVSLTAGRGDMLVWASSVEGRFGFAKLSFGKQPELTLRLDKREGDLFSVDIDIVPPAENAHLPEVTAAQRAENDRRMAAEDSIRNAYVATMWDEEWAARAIAPFSLTGACREKTAKILAASRGNHETLFDFLRFADGRGEAEQAAALLNVLSEKDWRDVSLTVLKDHFLSTPRVEGMDMVDWALLACPRVSDEMLTPYRSFFRSNFSEDEAEAFRKNPQALVDWVSQYVKVDGTYNSQSIPISPEGVWCARTADERSRDIFFVAVARSLGIPATMRSEDGKVGYTEKGAFMVADFDKKESGQSSRTRFRLYDENNREIAAGDDRVKYYSKYTLSRIDDGVPSLISLNEGAVNSGKLDAGYYLMVSGTRLASGGVLAHLSSFVLPAVDEGLDVKIEKEVVYRLRPSGENVAVIGNFNSESLFTPIEEGVGQKVSLSAKKSLLQACGRGYFVVGILGTGQEPTNHALRDIAALQSDWEKWGRKMVLLFPDETQAKKYAPSEFSGLPSTVVYGIDTDGICNQIVENMKLNRKGSLPIFIMADTFNRVVFVSQGYTIGLGEQLMKTVRGL